MSTLEPKTNRRQKRVYRVNDCGPFPSSFLKYRYTESKRLDHANKPLPAHLQREAIKSEADFIDEWIEFAKRESLEDSDLPCWVGHLEQFGRLMLEVIRFRESGKLPHDGSSCAWLESLIYKEHFLFNCAWGLPISSEERQLYRVWFGLLGHPNYSVDFRDPECTLLARYQLILSSLAESLNYTLLDKQTI